MCRCPDIFILPVGVVAIASVRSAELALRQDHLGRCLDRLFQEFLLLPGGLEGLALDDADRCQHTAQFGIDRRDRLVVDELLQLGPVGVIDRIHHVDALAAAVRKLHRLDVFLGRPKRIDARLLRERHGGLGVRTVFALRHDRPEEQKDIVGLRFEREVALRNLAVIIRRQQEVEPPRARSGPISPTSVIVRWKKSVNMPMTLGGAATTSGPVSFRSR